jgi:MoaA/NifB/PqqE/SkfB family radical SAM enzyme
MEVNLTLIYRGPLESCNYDCSYCPFAKIKPLKASLELDKYSLNRFVSWIESMNTHTFSVFFTPGGEALIYPWYQEAIQCLSKMPNIKKVVIQTNLSTQLEWLKNVVKSKVALWCTYHPLNVTQKLFLSKSETLDSLGIHHSVGIVGLKEFIGYAEAMRDCLSKGTYLWVNAYKRQNNYYSEEDLARLSKVDPYFYINNKSYESRGHRCQCGNSVFFINGEGNVKRCSFVKQSLGNIYTCNIENIARDEVCPNTECQCYIGYIHMDYLSLDEIYGDCKLERIPNVY